MDTSNLRDWRQVATAKIRCKPDREAVQREFHYHMQDKWEALREQGVPEKEIPQRILDDMGSARELAPILAEIHKPHWGYATMILKWVMVAMIVIACILGNLASNHTITDNAFTETESGSFSRICLLEPNASFQCDHYRLIIQKAALWESYHSTNHFTNTTTTGYTLRLQFRVTQPPFHPQFNAWEYFWAEDDLGNHYVADMQATVTSPEWGQIHFAGMYSRIFYDIGYLSISGIPSPDIQWMDLHFDLDGRDMTVRIDLTGGAPA